MLTMRGVTLTVGCDITVAGLLNTEMHTGHCAYCGTVVPCRVTDTSDNTLGSESRRMHATDCSVFTGHTKFSILREALLPRHTKGGRCSIHLPLFLWCEARKLQNMFKVLCRRTGPLGVQRTERLAQCWAHRRH